MHLYYPAKIKNSSWHVVGQLILFLPRRFIGNPRLYFILSINLKLDQCFTRNTIQTHSVPICKQRNNSLKIINCLIKNL